MILLDTTFLIDLLRKKKNAISKAIELTTRDKLSTTYINIYELLIGVYSIKDTDKEKKLQDVEKLMEKLEVFTLEKESTINSAKIGGDLILKGQVIGDTDNMIIGIALTNGITTIVTRDMKHYKKIKEIKVETY